MSINADGKFCASHADLYYANIAGKIQGGYDMLSLGDQTPCAYRANRDLRYREIDGKCNHPKDYGSTMKPVKRYLRPHYQDAEGKDAPRIYSVMGDRFLPSPRLISLNLFPDIPKVANTSRWTMQFGQLIDHDITSAPVPTGPNGTIKCCGVKDMPKECFPIAVPKEDPRFENCMEFVRSQAAADEKGNQLYPREQLNAITSFVDGSAFYGSDSNATKRLRTENGTGALLKTVIVNGYERLPNDTSARPGCLKSQRPESYCLVTGDRRANLHAGLSSAHLLFHLYHNFVVRSLAAAILKQRGQPYAPNNVEYFIANAPAYTKEKLFQEGKRVIGAIFQNIVFCDYLPIILGPQLIEKFKLGCTRRSKYNPYVDPRIANAFMSAAFRFGHTLVPNSFTINGKQEFLKDNFLVPDGTIYGFESLCKGFLEDGKNDAFDWFFSKSISEHLFETRTGPKGAIDLLSVNIQRARDHGIPAYYFWRRYYGLRRLTRFEDWGYEIGEKLRQLYNHVNDIDLFVGGVFEPPVQGGVVGETFGHIIANQFADLKFGDAYFFLSKEYPQGFNDEEIAAIQEVTFNSILCKSAQLQYVQDNTWFIPSESNPVRPCSVHPQFNAEVFAKYFDEPY